MPSFVLQTTVDRTASSQQVSAFLPACVSQPDGHRASAAT